VAPIPIIPSCALQPVSALAIDNLTTSTTRLEETCIDIKILEGLMETILQLARVLRDLLPLVTTLARWAAILGVGGLGSALAATVLVFTTGVIPVQFVSAAYVLIVVFLLLGAAAVVLSPILTVLAATITSALAMLGAGGPVDGLLSTLLRGELVGRWQRELGVFNTAVVDVQKVVDAQCRNLMAANGLFDQPLCNQPTLDPIG
jgi:hypothetical protein